jgi:hypothetical protein
LAAPTREAVPAWPARPVNTLAWKRIGMDVVTG